MIKLEHVVLASPEQMKFIIEGMRYLIIILTGLFITYIV